MTHRTWFSHLVRNGDGASLFLQPWSPHGVFNPAYDGLNMPTCTLHFSGAMPALMTPVTHMGASGTKPRFAS